MTPGNPMSAAETCDSLVAASADRPGMRSVMLRAVATPPTSCSNQSLTSGASNPSTTTLMPLKPVRRETRSAVDSGTSTDWATIGSPPAL